MQCLRAVPQDERTEQTSHQTQTQAGESRQCNNGREGISERVCVCGGGGSKSKECKVEGGGERGWGGTIPGKLYFLNQFPGIVFLAPSAQAVSRVRLSVLFLLSLLLLLLILSLIAGPEPHPSLTVHGSYCCSGFLF